MLVVNFNLGNGVIGVNGINGVIRVTVTIGVNGVIQVFGSTWGNSVK